MFTIQRENPMIYAVYYHQEKHSSLRSISLILLLIYSHFKHKMLLSYSAQYYDWNLTLKLFKEPS